MTIYYEEWLKKEYTCEGCSWQGTAEASARGRMHRGIYLDLMCPQCSDLLDVVIFEGGHSCEHKKEGMTEEAESASGGRGRGARYRSQCLSSTATVIVGQVPDDSMEDALRVTMVATGLGSPVARQQPKPMQIIRTGTDDAPMMVGDSEELPSVMSSRRSRTIQAMSDSGIDTLDIPAFLRRQAD